MTLRRCVNGDFDVHAAGTSLEELQLSARGTLSDSAMWGTHVPEMSFTAGIAESALTLDVKGAFDQLNPAVLLERKALDGNVNGTVDATLRWRHLAAPITAASIDVDGRVVLAPSLIGGVLVAGADVEGRTPPTADIWVHVDGPTSRRRAAGWRRPGSDSDRTPHQRRAISLAGRIIGRSGLRWHAALDGTVTHRPLETADAERSCFAHGELEVPDPTARMRRGRGLRLRNACRRRALPRSVVGGRAQPAEGNNDLRAEADGVEATVQQQTQSSASPNAIFHPDHQELHLPALFRADGIEWRKFGRRPRFSIARTVSIDLRLANAIRPHVEGAGLTRERRSTPVVGGEPWDARAQSIWPRPRSWRCRIAA
jgi:hypothetical protein